MAVLENSEMEISEIQRASDSVSSYLKSEKFKQASVKARFLSQEISSSMDLLNSQIEDLEKVIHEIEENAGLRKSTREQVKKLIVKHLD